MQLIFQGFVDITKPNPYYYNGKCYTKKGEVGNDISSVLENGSERVSSLVENKVNGATNGSSTNSNHNKIEKACNSCSTVADESRSLKSNGLKNEVAKNENSHSLHNDETCFKSNGVSKTAEDEKLNRAKEIHNGVK